MTQESYELKIWWGSREESAQQCALRFGTTINGLAAIDPVFSDWRHKGLGGPEIHRRFCAVPPDLAEAARLFESGRSCYDSPRKVWPEMGYLVSAWNHRQDDFAAAFAFRAGSFGDDNQHCNYATVRLGRRRLSTGLPWTGSELRVILKLMIDACNPREASVDCSRYFDFKARRENADGVLFPWEGWLTYIPADLTREVPVPPGVRIDTLPDGGIIATLCEEPFTIDNPRHMELAKAMQKALRPIQS
jgi:hypothetical protein